MKKKFLTMLALTVMTVCLFAVSAFAMPGELMYVNNTNGTGVNMRSGPGTGYAIVATYPNGTEMYVVTADMGSGWTQVTLGGSVNSVSGYMSSQYLAGEAAGVIDATRSMEVVSPYGTQSVVLRSEASDSYDAVAMLAVGASVQVIGVADGFYYVQLDGECVGCLASDELK